MDDEQENSDFSLGIDIEEQLQVEQLGEAINFCEFVNQLGEPSPEEEPMAAGLGGRTDAPVASIESHSAQLGKTAQKRCRREERNSPSAFCATGKAG